jgi:hypothetical protein
MDLHRTSAPCDSCGDHSLFLWLDRDGALICPSCVAALVRRSDREIARIRCAAVVTLTCFAFIGTILLWSWLAGQL